MVIVPLLLALLLQLRILMTVSGQSPCPPTFTYFRDKVTNKAMGKIWIRFPPLNQVEYHLRVEMRTSERLPDKNYAGEVTLEKSREDTIRDIQRGMPLVYLIHFPLERSLPRIAEIILNGEARCPVSYLPLTESYTGFIEMEHILYFDNSTQKWFETNFADLPFGRIAKWRTYSYYGGGLVVPLDAPIFDVLPTLSPARTPKPEKHGPTTVNVEGCGRNAKIAVPLVAGGVTASQGEWPWVVALFVQRHNLEYQCVGTILTNRHIITAAHCLTVKDLNGNLPPSALYASLGRNKLREWREEGSVNIQVLNYTIHPDYAYDASADSDLAILELWSSIEFSSTIKPICLWEGASDLENVVRKTGYLVGWGRDEFGNQSLSELQMVNLPIVSHTECFWSDPRFISFTSSRTFCAGSEDGSGPCNGDSGTGLMLYDASKDRYYIRGVASRSLVDRRTLACDLNHYVVFVDVAKYTDWIRGQISKD